MEFKSTKNKRLVKENVFRQYKSVYFLSKCLLLGPPSLKKQEAPSGFHRIGLLILTAAYIYTSYLAFVDVETLHPIGGSLISLNMDRAVLFFNTILVLVTLNSTRKYRASVFDYLQSLHNFDLSCLKYFGRMANSNGKSLKNIRVFFMHLLLSITFLLSEIGYSIKEFGYVQGYNICFLIGFVLRKCVVLQYVTIVNFCYWRFKFLNLIVVNFYNKQNEKTMFLLVEDYKTTWYKSQHVRNTLTMVRLLHEDLCAVCRDLIDKYGLFQCMAIITGLVEQLALAYGIFVTLTNDEGYSSSYIALSIIRSLCYVYVVAISQFYFVFYFCDIVKRESMRAGYLVQRFYLQTNNRNELMEPVKLFALQIKQTELFFSAAGIFILDWELMSAIANEVTSYLVFFIQSSGFSFAVDKNFDPRMKPAISQPLINTI
ncbi:PREDICTED: uncharacterized protein LOC108568590 [Nicrophorus vespilloides]|uniref:Gustatory receptor n=1 Tax=Nicrophorus vespilloides TaxID=110193 RepID=A0ABM1NEL0_NICVS|nr:PREDICTED: uncharacterized protein LOC108568590 [Nicrophorus vespilloides]